MVNLRHNRAKKVVNQNKETKTKSAKSANTKGGGTSGFYYSFLTIILILCLIQITISAVLNVSKVISYKAKIKQITKNRDDALALNEQLKDNINNFSNVSGLEAIARNNLKMSSPDEVLVIINVNNDDKESDKEDKGKGFFSRH